ncbi:hypothetical protein [Vibrio aestuarianus]|uniref:Uncharacterized protein n=1 Tax=Vibrio aestuarianus TaxID=28171 RepID=A0AAX3U8F9_9VIBR|nr:hypothetical protein [Vibrio aestuarianus]WGK83244.1 hypothetical protein PYE51_17970 [Vibrio aestuarianus]WGK87140.1 hypothetical protein PYE67_13485 [Vibrio aestuarianus]CAH8236666.1 hypothetical protein VAEU17_4400164 [Vibrio aestuarianus]
MLLPPAAHYRLKIAIDSFYKSDEKYPVHLEVDRYETVYFELT